MANSKYINGECIPCLDNEIVEFTNLPEGIGNCKNCKVIDSTNKYRVPYRNKCCPNPNSYISSESYDGTTCSACTEH